MKNKLEKVYKEIERYLKRRLTEYEKMYVEKWNIEYKYDFSVIEFAFKKTTTKKNPNFNYIDKIISYWKEKRLKNVKEIEQDIL